jgi:hypothetical protein
MSRAFVNEDAGGGAPRRGYGLPARDDPGFDAAAAAALLEAARAGETESAEHATGYYWGEPRLRAHVQRIQERARVEGDDRLEQLARRYLG